MRRFFLANTSFRGFERPQALRAAEPSALPESPQTVTALDCKRSSAGLVKALRIAAMGGMFAIAVCSTVPAGAFYQSHSPFGGVRLIVQPESAAVVVDGHEVGRVADVPAQRLRLTHGPHRLEFRAAGYEPAAADICISSGQTMPYRVELRRK